MLVDAEKLSLIFALFPMHGIIIFHFWTYLPVIEANNCNVNGKRIVILGIQIENAVIVLEIIISIYQTHSQKCLIRALSFVSFTKKIFKIDNRFSRSGRLKLNMKLVDML